MADERMSLTYEEQHEMNNLLITIAASIISNGVVLSDSSRTHERTVVRAQ
jgi:hypothetical protein